MSTLQKTAVLAALSLSVCLVSGAGAVRAEGPHHPPIHHPPVHQPHHQPPVVVPRPPQPVVPPTLQNPRRPETPPAVRPETAEAPDIQRPAEINQDDLPEAVYYVGDDSVFDVLAEPPKAPVVGPFFCDWYCEANKMFPDAEDPYGEYQKWTDAQYRLREERRNYLLSGEAIPADLRLALMEVKDIKYREDENGVGRFYVRLDGFGKGAVFSVAADDIDGGIAANILLIQEVAAHTAGYIEQQADWYQRQSETFNGSEYDKERFELQAETYRNMLAGYRGEIFEREEVPIRDFGSADYAIPGVGPETASGEDTPIIPVPDIDLDDPIVLVDAIASEDTSLIDPSAVGGWGDPALDPGSDAVLQELVRTTRDFGGGEVMIDIDVVDTGAMDRLMEGLVYGGIDVGLAVAGAVNPVAGVTIAFGKNAKETYDYAISQGLSVRQAIFAATTAGAVGGADTYIVGMGIGKVAGWVGPALSSAGTQASAEALEHGIGTAGNASGFSLVGNVGKALVDKIAHKNKNPELYQRPRRRQPTGPGQVTYIMAGGGNWQQNALR